MELDYDENGVMKKIECEVKCKADKTSKLTATVGCEPVFDSNGEVVGARYIHDPAGFDRYQEICGGGCPTYDLRTHMGPDLQSLPTAKCSKVDSHYKVSIESILAK